LTVSPFSGEAIISPTDKVKPFSFVNDAPGK
jgi:hypothetical protein